MRYLPAWFPGAGFRREAQRGYDQRQYYTNVTFGPVVRDVVCVQTVLHQIDILY